MNIKTIPFDAPFLQVLAKYIAEKHEKISPDFGSILVVFPSERNKVYFRHYLLEETKTQGIIPPCILTMEQLYDYILEKIISDFVSKRTCDMPQKGQFEKSAIISEDIERNVFLKQAVEEIKFKNFEQLPFVKFVSIGRKLLAFFDELANWDLSIKDIENIKDKLHFPPQYIDEELSIFGKIHKKYEELLNDRGLIDITSVHLSAAKNFKSEYLKDFEHIYIAGCLALTHIDIMLAKKILTDLPSELLIHSEKGSLSDGSLDNIFYHHNKILKMLDADIRDIKSVQMKTANKKTSVYIQKCKSALDEVYFVIKAVSELSPRYPLNRIGIVLPDESLYLPIKDALEKFKIPYNLSMGIPFRHTMLYSFLKDIYDFIDSDFSAGRFLTLIKNPVIKGITKDGESLKELVYKVDVKIREANLSKIYGEFSHAEAQKLIDYIFGIINKLNKDCPFGEYVKIMREIIQGVIESNPELHRKTSALLTGLMEKLLKIESFKIPDRFCLKGKEKLKFIISVLETISFPISGDFLSGVQVIGILESRNIDFDCAIIPSCNEGIFPQKSEKDLFMPSGLRQELKLPFYKERDALYSYYFHQLLSGKKEVYLSYRSDEKTQLVLRNRWIERLIEGGDERFAVNEIKETHLADFSRLFAAGSKNFSYRKTKKHKKGADALKNDKILNTLKSFTFSPSILKTFKQCHYKFYLSYILKLKEPKAIIEEYNASIWGKIFHNTLARLYNEKYPEGYNENLKQQVIKNLLKISEEEFKKAYPEAKPSLYWDWEAGKQRMLNLIDKEIAHFKEGFKPIKLEKELTPYEVTINNKQKVKIGGRPDRIDAKPATPARQDLAGGTTTAGRCEKFYIIDYKTGKKPASKAYRIPAAPATETLAGKVKDFTEFQLPLYGLTFAKGDTQKIGGLLYYYLDENMRDFIQLDILKEEGPGYIRKFQEEILLPTLTELFNKNLPFCKTEDFDICQRCAFIDHCGRRV